MESLRTSLLASGKEILLPFWTSSQLVGRGFTSLTEYILHDFAYSNIRAFRRLIIEEGAKCDPGKTHKSILPFITSF